MQVVTGDVFHDASATFANEASAGDELDPQQEIPRGAITIAQRAIGARGDHSAQSGLIVKWRRDGQELAFLPELARTTAAGDPRLDAERDIARLAGQNSIHS